MLKKFAFAAAALLCAAASAAFAADLPSTKSFPAISGPGSAYNWTGFYAGLEGGMGFVDPKGKTFNAPMGAALAGALVGGNYQFGSLVVGAEADGGGVMGAHQVQPLLVSTGSNYYANIRGRLGYAIGNILPFVAGGAAFNDVHVSYPAGQTFLQNRVGWTAGAGVEYGFTPNVIGRVEYRYTDMGRDAYLVSSHSDAVLAALVYKF